MGFYNVINAPSMVAGQPEDVSQVLANFNAIASVLNGNLDNANLAAAAGILISKLAPGSPGQVASTDLSGNVSWLGGLQQISDTTLGADGLFDIVGIPQTHKHLLLMGQVRAASAVTVDTSWMRFNNDSGSNYDVQNLSASAAVTAAAEGFGGSTLSAFVVPGTTAPANSYGAILAFIPDYTNTLREQSVWTAYAAKGGTTTGTLTVGVKAGFWRPSAGVNRITVQVLSTPFTFKADSRLTLYALG